jgi:hypothetical protein
MEIPVRAREGSGANEVEATESEPIVRSSVAKVRGPARAQVVDPDDLDPVGEQPIDEM